MSTVNLNTRVRGIEKKQSTGFATIINKWFTRQADKFEEARFGMMAMYIIIQSCIASVAAMYILQNDAPIIYLCTTSALAMASNAVFIAQGSAKLCLAVFYISVLVNVLFILFNL